MGPLALLLPWAGSAWVTGSFALDSLLYGHMHGAPTSVADVGSLATCALPHTIGEVGYPLEMLVCICILALKLAVGVVYLTVSSGAGALFGGWWASILAIRVWVSGVSL